MSTNETQETIDTNEMQDIKRERRRKRRQRNQFLAISVVAAIVVVIAGLGIFGYMKLRNIQTENEHKEEVADKLDELTADEPDVPVISEPDVDVEVEIPEVDPVEEELKTMISEMSIEDKVAGLFFVTPEAITRVSSAVQAGNGTKEALEEFPVGGLIYFKNNIRSEEQIKTMIENTKSYSANRVFIGVNEEGGSVSSVASKLKVTKVDTAETLGKNATTDTTYTTGKTIGTYLSDLGFNVNFAPVADVAVDPENTLLGDRSFGSDSAKVGEHVGAMVNGLEEVGVSACVKAFPGMGAANKDPEDGFSTTERTLEEMRSAEFVSFKAAIEQDADFIMVSNVAAPNVIGGEYLPSCMSKIMVNDILREELGYDGVLITAPLNEAAVTEYYTSGDAVIEALNAGVDMFLMPENFEEAYYALLAEVLEGNVDESRIDESLLRIYKIKYADMWTE